MTLQLIYVERSPTIAGVEIWLHAVLVHVDVESHSILRFLFLTKPHELRVGLLHIVIHSIVLLKLISVHF